MKRFTLLILLIFLLFTGCAQVSDPAQIAATTLPVYEFTATLCQGTSVSVTRLVTEEVSCLHDYSLNLRQVRAAEAAEVIIVSGAGLETFLADVLEDKACIDASQGIALICPDEDGHDHGDSHDHEGHHHDQDPHIWLSPVNAIAMAQNICQGLSMHYPEHSDVFESNLDALVKTLEDLQLYGENALSNLSSREMITFHDGFSYFAESFGLTILEAVEEESGSEASALELIRLVEIVHSHGLHAIFTETNGSVSAAEIISRETGAACYTLDMAMSGDSYFESMYRNINTIKEALE